MAPRVALVAQVAFTAWDHSYAVGDTIPPEHTALWHDGTLANRLNSGDVQYLPVDVEQLELVEDEDEEGADEDEE